MAPLAFAALIKRGEKACGLPKGEKNDETVIRPHLAGETATDAVLLTLQLHLILSPCYSWGGPSKHVPPLTQELGQTC